MSRKMCKSITQNLASTVCGLVIIVYLYYGLDLKVATFKTTTKPPVCNYISQSTVHCNPFGNCVSQFVSLKLIYFSGLSESDTCWMLKLHLKVRKLFSTLCVKIITMCIDGV